MNFGKDFFIGLGVGAAGATAINFIIGKFSGRGEEPEETEEEETDEIDISDEDEEDEEDSEEDAEEPTSTEGEDVEEVEGGGEPGPPPVDLVANRNKPDLKSVVAQKIQGHNPMIEILHDNVKEDEFTAYLRNGVLEDNLTFKKVDAEHIFGDTFWDEIDQAYDPLEENRVIAYDKQGRGHVVAIEEFADYYSSPEHLLDDEDDGSAIFEDENEESEEE